MGSPAVAFLLGLQAIVAGPIIAIALSEPIWGWFTFWVGAMACGLVVTGEATR